jgi:hypothetical protein
MMSATQNFFRCIPFLPIDELILFKKDGVLEKPVLFISKIPN